jgi:hypothetical protein
LIGWLLVDHARERTAGINANQHGPTPPEASNAGSDWIRAKTSWNQSEIDFATQSSKQESTTRAMPKWNSNNCK